MSYLTNENVADFLNITLEAAGAALVDDIIASLSAYVDGATGRTWSTGASTDIVEKFDGGGSQFVVSKAPINTVSSVKVDGVTLTADEYYVYGYMVRTDRFTSPGFLNVEITYRTTATTIPADLKHALLQWVAQVFKASTDGGKIATRFSSGPVSMDFAVKEGVPELMQVMIARHRKFAIG